MGRVEDYPVEQWDVMIAVLLSAPFHLTKMAIPHMKRKGIPTNIQKIFAFLNFTKIRPFGYHSRGIHTV